MKAKAKDYNVLFIISDQHKKSVTGCYGDPAGQGGATTRDDGIPTEKVPGS